MICQHCRSAVGDKDRFCPKCGGALTRPGTDVIGLGVPAMPPTVDAPSHRGPRVEPLRSPVPEGGTKYRGLKLAADLMIKHAAILRIVFYVLAGLGSLSALILMQDRGALAFVLAVMAGIATAILGWLTWLLLTILGELMYVVIDVEENLRRRA
ncbi:MAG: hypothetical protein ACPL7K_00225 [Armatimonadota bacterium]